MSSGKFRKNLGRQDSKGNTAEVIRKPKKCISLNYVQSTSKADVEDHKQIKY